MLERRRWNNIIWDSGFEPDHSKAQQAAEKILCAGMDICDIHYLRGAMDIMGAQALQDNHFIDKRDGKMLRLKNERKN